MRIFWTKLAPFRKETHMNASNSTSMCLNHSNFERIAKNFIKGKFQKKKNSSAHVKLNSLALLLLNWQLYLQMMAANTISRYEDVILLRAGGYTQPWASKHGLFHNSFMLKQWRRGQYGTNNIPQTSLNNITPISNWS